MKEGREGMEREVKGERGEGRGGRSYRLCLVGVYGGASRIKGRRSRKEGRKVGEEARRLEGV